MYTNAQSHKHEHTGSMFHGNHHSIDDDHSKKNLSPKFMSKLVPSRAIVSYTPFWEFNFGYFQLWFQIANFVSFLYGTKVTVIGIENKWFN